MQLLETKKEKYIGQADPYIFESNGKYYIYTTGSDGIYAYTSDELFNGWQFVGKVFEYKKSKVDSYWAPSVIEIDGTYYMYNSFEYYDVKADKGGHHQAMFVS